MKERIRQSLWRISGIPISVYAGNATFFLILSVLPLATLLLGILQYLPFTGDELVEMLSRVVPEAAVPLFRFLFVVNNPPAVISVSAVAAIWSASRGTYGILRGLNRAYELHETRHYIRVRLHCVLDTLLLVLAILAALLLYVYGQPAEELLSRSIFSFLVNPVTRFLFTTVMLILLFSLLYLILPNHHVRFHAVLPGAAFSGAGWMVFSAIYSFYVSHFSGMNRLYGSLSTVAFAMLWLYFCMQILFLGAVVNHSLAEP